MRFIILCLILFSGASLYAQSKKELQDQVAQLKAEIAELKKPKPVIEPKVTSVKDSACYGIGILLGSNVKRQVGDTMNVEVLLQGMKDVFDGKPLKFDENKASMILQQTMQKSMERKSSKAKTESKVFMDENKKKPGVITTASGLQYQIINHGKGAIPTASSQVTVHYTGKLVDGTVFDSSVERGEPATFGVGEVIKGWTEALQLMHEGDKWMLFIPADLGYGDRGSGPQIPPFSALIFEVELIKIN